MSFNDIDKALKSVGISMKDANNQFREFDDVIDELGAKWEKLDSTSQRYIATQFAGTNQQSRFLALMQNYDRYKELQDEAMNSEDAGTLQYLKTLDSVETKIQQLKTAFQDLYVNSGLQDFIKGLLDLATKLLTNLNKMPKLFNKIPVAMLAIVSTIVIAFKRGIMDVAAMAAAKIEETRNKINASIEENKRNAQAAANGVHVNINPSANGGANNRTNGGQGDTVGRIASLIGLAANVFSMTTSSKGMSGALQIGGAVANGVATGFMMPGTMGMKIMAGIASALPGLVSGISMIATGISHDEKVSNFKQNITNTHNDTLVSKNELKTLEDYKKKLEEAKAAQYDSVEAKQEYYDIMNEIADAYPEFFSYMDEEGNKVVELGKQYDELRRQKQEAYLGDLVEEGAANISALQDADYMAAMLYNNISGPNSYGYFDIDQYALGNELRAEMLELFRNNSDAVASEVIRAQGRQEWNYLLGESKTVNDTFDNLLLSLYGRSALRDVEQNPLVASDSYKVIDAAQKGYSYDKMLQDSGLESVYTPLEEVYNAYLNFFKELNTNVKYVDKQLFTQIKQIVSAYNQIYDWGYGNSEQQFFSSEISKVIQEQAANIEDPDERAQKIEGLLNELRMMGNVDEWISKYDDAYVNLWEGVDEATKKSIDELAAKSNDTSAAVFETKLRKLLGDGHDKLIDSLMQEYTDTVDWTTEDFINALGEYSLQKDKGVINTRPFENLTPAMQQSLIASLKSADEDGNRGLVSATENLYSFLNNLNEAQMGIASGIMKTADFTTISGLRKFQQEMAKNNIDVSKQVERIKANTHFNLVTEIGDFVSTVSKQLDDYEKFLSSAEKGMGFKDANAAAQKMGLDITKDFTFDNGAYFLNNFDKVRESYAKYYQDLMDAYGEEVKRLGENYTSLAQNLDSDAMMMEINPETRAQQEQEVQAAYDKWRESQAAYNKAKEMSQNAVDYLFNTFLLSTGKFSDFVSSLGLDSSVVQFMQNGDVEGVKAALGDQWNTYGSAIVEAISNAPYDLMSNLIKGIESGEIFTVTQEQYQSIAGDESLQKAFNIVVDSVNGEVSLQMVNLAEAWKYIQELLDKGTIKNVKQYNEVAKQIASYEEARNTPVATLLDSFENLYHITDTELIEYADKIGVDSKKFIDAWNNSAELDAVPRLLYAARAAGASMNRTTEDVRAVLLKYDDLFEEVSNAMQKGTQGASFSEAVSIAEQLGKDVDDLFELRGTKLVFKDLQDFSSIYSMYIDKLASLGYEISPLAQQYAQSLASNDLIENGQWTEAFAAAASGVDNRAQLEPAFRGAVEGVFSSIGENIANGVSIIAEDSNREILQNLAGMGIVKEVANDVYKVVEGKQGDFLRAVAGAEALTVEQQMSILEESINNLSTEMYSGDLLATLSQMAKEATGKMKDKILEMMQSLLSNITSAITNGISGSASASDISNLETQLGVSIKTDRTADGYKIQQNSLYEVYNAVKDIDTIAAQTVLTALAESAQTSDERLNDVFYIMERIKDINDELAKPNVSDARRKKLQAELDIAEELQKQLKEADNTFDFMSRDLASGYDDPLSAWKGMGTAGEVLNGDDYAKGLVGFQDFSNMISFMGDDVLREAGILNDKSQTASDLILAASGALKNVGGETFVDLSALGANFNTGSEVMKEGLMKAVQNLAKSQIEIIDAEIKVLETVVASQDAFEKLKGDKTELTADDLLPKLSTDYGAIQEALAPLEDLLQNYTFEAGQTIHDILLNPILLDSLTPTEREWLASILNSLNGEDWTTLGDDVKQQVVDKLNAAFEAAGVSQRAELTVGDDGLVITFAENTKEVMDDANSAASELDDNISALQDTAETNNPFQPWETTLANCEASIARIDNYISGNSNFGNNNGQTGGSGSGSVGNRNNQKSSRFSAVAYDDGGISATTKSLQSAQTTVVDSLDAAITKLNELAQVVANIPDKAAEVNKLVNAINRLRSKTLSLSATISLDIETTGANVSRIKTNVRSGASKTGVENIKAKVAAAKGTLMGELGPEMVVSNGHYFMVGQQGAEFVNLDKDAIVFNHLQTQQLMSTGLTSRGTAYTNEKNATSYAKGNTTGPAMASAADALAELRKIRAQWQELLDNPASALGAKAGSGGGSGGGGSSKDSKAQIHDLERWYNLLRQIEKYEQKITYEQQKRENLQNGYNYVDSLEKELEYLKKQQKVYSDLASLQKSYYDARRKDLLSTDYSMIFRYDEDGLMQYVDGANKGLDILAKLNETDANGAPINNAKDSSTQLAYLKSIGFDVAHLSTNADGSSAEDDDQRMQNFWDNVDGWMEELDGLYDEYNEHLTSVEENTAKQNEILQEYIDNQLSIEEKLLTAVEDRQQAIIDSLQDQKDALEESSQAYIDGLSDALNKERNMYDKQSTADETAKLRRQLSILQRAGGSAAEIKSLQDQIDGRMKDEYFDKMQEQIDAVQEASDKQLEKLQNQIDLLTESLEYQKENGLLWQEVYDMMNSWTPEKMLQFIEEFTKTYKENSDLQKSEDSKDTFKELQIWDAKRTSDQRNSDWSDYYSKLDKRFDSVKEDNAGLAQDAFARGYGEGGRTAAEAAANAVFEEALKKAANGFEPDGNGNGNTSGSNAEDNTVKGDATFKNKNYKVYSYDDATTDKKGFVIYGNGKDVSFKVHDEQGGRILISGTDGKGQKIDKRWVPKRYFQYANGGLVDYTGPAWVDGTKAKPEAFLSAEDTRLLKSKIFSNSTYSLRSTLEAIENLGKTFANVSTGENSGQSINIEKLEVAIQPGVISSDYDAKRAGEMALEEMVRIARKTTNRVVSR
nr:MAG TPA: tail tape measure protein [Caudoviricetes sp.]